LRVQFHQAPVFPIGRGIADDPEDPPIAPNSRQRKGLSMNVGILRSAPERVIKRALADALGKRRERSAVTGGKEIEAHGELLRGGGSDLERALNQRRIQSFEFQLEDEVTQGGWAKEDSVPRAALAGELHGFERSARQTDLEAGRGRRRGQPNSFLVRPELDGEGAVRFEHARPKFDARFAGETAGGHKERGEQCEPAALNEGGFH
jgi:hypothetical protein